MAWGRARAAVGATRRRAVRCRGGWWGTAVGQRDSPAGGVTGFHIGDRVAIEPIVGCGRCGLCKGGRYNLCRKRALADGGVRGAV